jgi:hypothetical protein
MAAYKFASDEFIEAVRAGTHKAFLETLEAGRPVFYTDRDGLEVMELPDGRRFEIRWNPSSPNGENYDVVREIAARAA